MEKLLDENSKMRIGVDYENEKSINEPPMTEFGVEQKVSDTGLRMITNFSGDNNESGEEDLTVFLRGVFSLIQTNKVTEKASNSVLLRKLIGSAQILIDTFIEKAGGIEQVTFRQLVAHLEKSLLSEARHCIKKIFCIPYPNKTSLLLNSRPRYNASRWHILSHELMNTFILNYGAFRMIKIKSG